MRIPLITRINIEDVPAANRDWMGKILTPINSFIGAVAPALTNRLTFSDNFLGQQQALDFRWNGNNLPIAFKVTMPATPQALSVISAYENVTTPVAVIVAWTFNSQGQVSISDISKITNGTVTTLTNGARYQIAVRITP